MRDARRRPRRDRCGSTRSQWILNRAAQRLLEAIDPAASLVLIGEATHGTQEFYRIRADLTRALIQQRGFNLVAVEADWPDAYRANQWVRLHGDDSTAEDALADFTRFPRWMWRNREVVRFLRWLRSENAERRRRRARRLLRTGSLQPASLDGARHRVPRQGRSRRRAAGASGLRVLRCFRRGRAAVRLRGQPRTSTARARTRSSSSSSSCDGARRSTPARWPHRRRRVFRRGTERPRRSRTRRPTTAPCSAAARNPGTSGIGT